MYGGGWPEMKMAKAVEELAARTPGELSGKHTAIYVASMSGEVEEQPVVPDRPPASGSML